MTSLSDNPMMILAATAQLDSQKDLSKQTRIQLALSAGRSPATSITVATPSSTTPAAQQHAQQHKAYLPVQVAPAQKRALPLVLAQAPFELSGAKRARVLEPASAGAGVRLTELPRERLSPNTSNGVTAAVAAAAPPKVESTWGEMGLNKQLPRYQLRIREVDSADASGLKEEGVCYSISLFERELIEVFCT